MSTVKFQNEQVYRLGDGDSQVLIAPQFGARLLTWVLGQRTAIHWPAQTNWQSSHDVAHTRGGNPILFPFLGRHFVDGQVGKWRDEHGTVREMGLHGFARDLPFEVVQSDGQSLRMRLEANEETRAMYPFEFRFDVVYALKENVLEATFETTNLGDSPMPYYAGHHFYFAIEHDRRADWSIDLPCRKWGHQNPDGSIRFEEALSQQTTLADEKLIDRFHLEFDRPQVLLHNAKQQQSIAIEWDQEYSSLWYDVTTWTQAIDSDFYCVEPWLGLPNAIHHGQGLRWLETGEKQTAVCRVKVS